MDRARVPFADVLASVDAVVSKPGFGIVSECVVNRKPLLYVDRPDFPEARILVEAIRKYLKQQEIPPARLYRGELGDFLESLWDQPEPTMTMASGAGSPRAKWHGFSSSEAVCPGGNQANSPTAKEIKGGKPRTDGSNSVSWFNIRSAPA